VFQDISQQGCVAPSFELRTECGALLGYFSNSSADGYSGVRIMRSELHQILLEKLRGKGVKVLFGMSLGSVREEDGKVTASFNDGTMTEEAGFLVDADGIHSKVRKYVTHPQELLPEYTGTALVYGILNTNVLPEWTVSSMHATSGDFGRKEFFASAFCDMVRTRLYWISSVTKGRAEKL
jgi:2-polyprenyl-6-methoxyphenol hydroxylase-like FAD-dependent oxidoreductase